MPIFLLTFHHHFVNIHFHHALYFILKHPRYHPLICDPSIFKPKWHHGVVVVGVRGDECRLFLVFRCQGDLMILPKGIQEAHSQVSICSIYQLFDLRHWEQVFWACPILEIITPLFYHPPSCLTQFENACLY